MTQFSEPRFGVDDVPMSSRTSVMAVLSLVAGLISLVGCCTLGVGSVIGIAGVTLGIIAMFVISGSQGRVGGMGLAIGGVVTSLIGMAAGIAVLIGVNLVLQQFKPYGNAVTLAQAADHTGLDKLMTTKAANEATAEGLEKFRTKTLADLGAFKGVKPGLIAFFTNFGKLDKAKGQIQIGGQPGMNTLPVPVEFDKGETSMFLVLDSTTGAQPDPSAPFGKIINLGIMEPSDGTVIWLIEEKPPAKGGSSTPPTGATVPPPPAPPKTPEKPSQPAEPK